ncbi:Site-specific recombinase XerD [Lachnospiraceae bacterium NE2001]|nr:Site-specific recombinase XerD [Lachnospiraceae bacterium NE2001]
MNKRLDNKRRVLKKGESQYKDGRYAFRMMIDGKTRIIVARTLTELRKKEKELFDKMEEGIDLDKQDVTLNALADKYIAAKAKTVQKTTLQTMTFMYDRYVRDNIGTKKVSELKRSHVKDFYLTLISGSKGISISTLSRLNTIVKPILEMAINDDIIVKNPAKDVMSEIKNEAGYVPNKKPALTEEQQDAFLKYVKSSKKHAMIKNLIIFLLGTGCRIGEAVAIRWDDIDFDSNMIYINHAVAYIKEDGKYKQFIKDPKSYAGNRKIPMLSDVRDALLGEKYRQEDLGIVSPTIDGYTNFAFVSLRGTIYTRDNICLQIKQIVSEYNEEHENNKLPVFTTHQLRHTFATRLCRGSDDLKAIQSILGHADISTTMNIYADATSEGVIESMESLEGKIFKKDDDI